MWLHFLLHVDIKEIFTHALLKNFDVWWFKKKCLNRALLILAHMEASHIGKA